MKKFFILSNHFKNRLLEILSFENRGSRQQQRQNNREVVKRPYGCVGLSMTLFANTQQLIGKFYAQLMRSSVVLFFIISEMDNEQQCY